MSDLTTYFGNKILRWILGHPMPTAPTFIWLALFNGNPKTSGVEVTGLINGYGRVPILFGDLALGTGNQITLASLMSFGQSENAVTVTHAALYDGVFGGNSFVSDAITGQPYSIAAGDLVEFQPGDINFTIGT
jgi:hypothetical protein